MVKMKVSTRSGIAEIPDPHGRTGKFLVAHSGVAGTSSIAEFTELAISGIMQTVMPSSAQKARHDGFRRFLKSIGRSLLSAGRGALPKEFEGRIHNLSNGGICILSSTPLQADTFVTCNLPVLDIPVSSNDHASAMDHKAGKQISELHQWSPVVS